MTESVNNVTCQITRTFAVTTQMPNMVTNTKQLGLSFEVGVLQSISYI